MAHALQVADDCRKLVSCIIEQNGQSLTDQVLEQSNRSAVKEVRATHFSRTNQFDVEKQLDGLEEKFSVLNNDALAYALQKLRTELKDSSYDFTPEVLSLLLLLSDRPAEKTRITDLVDETHVPETALLTWRDILAEDPLTEEGIWDYIERGSHSSGYVSNDEEFPTRDRPSKDWRNSKDFELNRQLLDSLSLPVTTAELETFRDKAKKTASSTFASDISFVKELLRTLQGLSRSHPINQPEETDMGQDFHIDGSLASSTLSNIRSEVRGIAKSITWLRNWTASPSTDVLQQRQRHIASRWLHEFDLQLSSIETRCIDKDHHTIITPQSVFDEVVALSMPITLLGDLAIQAADYSASFALLDGLYFRCSTSDVCGQMQDLKRLSSFFLPCLMVYLSVFEDWMSSGSAPAVSSDESFVFRIKDGHSVNLSNLWHDRFEIVHHNGAPNVLSFLSEHVSKLFTCGKSAAFLKALGTEPERTPRAALYFTEETMITPHDSYTVSAFDDRFRQSLLEWLRASYDVSAGRLGQVLLNKHYLGETMAALGSVLLGGNGNAMEEFALTLYELMDTESSEKGVRQSTLTALAQSAWEVDLHDAKLERALLMSFDTKTAASSGFLDGLRISLELPWPIQNITRESEPRNCQAAFNLLLQLHRARYVLSQMSVRNIAGALRGAGHAAPAFLKMRHKLRCFTDIAYGSLLEAGSSCTKKLVASIRTTKDIDTMASAYQLFRTTIARSFFQAEAASTILLNLTKIFTTIEQLGREWHVMSTAEQGSDVASNALEQITRDFDMALKHIRVGLRAIENDFGERSNLLAQLDMYGR